jgi:hypothetical protein
LQGANEEVKSFKQKFPRHAQTFESVRFSILAKDFDNSNSGTERRKRERERERRKKEKAAAGSFGQEDLRQRPVRQLKFVKKKTGDGFSL